MPFRQHFDCLWCGRRWDTRDDEDIEGWAGLCPECLGKADDNGFLRARLRAGLRERAAAMAGDWEDWYLRRGRFSRGPVHDGAWTMELDQATRWLDALPLSGTIVELGAGMGWWSGLLAEKGELWVYDDDATSLEAARKRLLAHRLMAHLHERDPLASPDKGVDAVFAAYLLGRAESETELDARVTAARAWLRPGGSLVLVEAAPTEDESLVMGPAGPLWPRSAARLSERITAAGFDAVEFERTRAAFVLGHAVRSD